MNLYDLDKNEDDIDGMFTVPTVTETAGNEYGITKGNDHGVTKGNDFGMTKGNDHGAIKSNDYGARDGDHGDMNIDCNESDNDNAMDNMYTSGTSNTVQ